ncbi:tetratricopeptide repeat protein [Chryseobacterium indologenes]|uniref:tetratricopeptide repeat protein n=1 Tax=Chryseobacterium indologenes TaxID=253 RepID=UPI00064708CD|nr:LuxR C-terminal-related transcriptional regulator [Chryseobacterium indologenes]
MIKKKLLVLFFVPLFFTAKLPTKKEIDSLILVAYNNQFNVDVVKFVMDSKTVLSKSEQIGYSRGRTTSCVFIASGLYDLGDYQKALTYLSIAEKEKFAQSDFIVLSEICRMRGRIYSSMEFKDTAIKLFKEGIGYIDRIKDDGKRKQALSLAFQNLVESYEKAKKFDSMYVYLKKEKNVLDNSNEKNVFPNAINFYSSLGQYYTYKSKYDSAAYSFARAENLIRKYSFPYTSANEKGRGLMEMSKNNPETALKHYFLALDNAKKNKFKSEEVELYSLIASAYSKSGNISTSKEYDQKALLLASRLNLENKQSIEYISNEILKDKIKKASEKNHTVLIVFSIFFFVILLGVTVVYLRTYKRNKKLISETVQTLLQKENALLMKEKETEILQQKLGGSFFEVVQLAKENSPEFFTRFNEVYPEFRNKLLEISPRSKTSELTFCAYLFLNFSTKDIAEFTFTSPRTVQTRKYNIRKKFNIPTDEDLYIWIQNIARK